MAELEIANLTEQDLNVTLETERDVTCNQMINKYSESDSNIQMFMIVP